MKLSKLLEIYGDDNYKFQNLDTDILQMVTKKKHTEIKFGTNETFNAFETQKQGLVIWLDRDKTKQILGDNK